MSLLLLSGCTHSQVRAPSSAEDMVIPIFFPIFKDVGQYPVVPCSIGALKGNCILDTGANMSKVSVNATTSTFQVLQKAKSISAYGERTNEVVQVPQLKLGEYVVKNNLPAVRSNDYHDLPEYLAVVGADILIGTNFIFHLGSGDTDPAKLILNPSSSGPDVKTFKQFGQMFSDKQFIVLRLSIGGERIKAVWDTHFGWSGFSKRFIQNHPRSFKRIGSLKNTDASGKSGRVNIYELLQPVCITTETCVMPTTNVMEVEIQTPSQDEMTFDVWLGNNFIWQFSWYFDFHNHRFAIQPR